jgi:ATP-dependent DNA helicase DinG
VTRRSAPTSRRTRRCGRWSPRRATTASARTVRGTRSASSWPRVARLAADLVVVNHHLFFADVMLRDEGTAELLPACNTVIFDEAHQLPEVASLFFGDSVSTAQLLELARDTQIEGWRRRATASICPGCVRARKGGSRLASDTAGGAGPLRAGAARRRCPVCEALAPRDRRPRSAGRCWKRRRSAPRARELLAACERLAARLQSWQSGANADFVAGARRIPTRCSSTRRRW